MEFLAFGALVGSVYELISKIKEAAEMAEKNKGECAYLVEYLSIVYQRLHRLPQHPDVEGPLRLLRSTLEMAHKLVVDCRKQSAFRQFRRARSYADKFREINTRIHSELNLFPLAFHPVILGRLDQIIHLAHHYGGASMLPAKTLKSTMLPAGTTGSGSVAVKTHKVVSSVSDLDDGQPRNLTWAEIAAATDNLKVVLGRGRSGVVYRGRLHHHGMLRVVAVKELKKHGRLGLGMEDAFVTELETLFPLRHHNIAPLVGWCAEGERRIFVYHHMSNGTLRDHLQGLRGGGGAPLASSWKSRLEVLLGAAGAIQHLHNRRHDTPPVIHRNITSSSILLDESWTSRLSDFGQALWQEAGELGRQGQLVPEVIGTFGYIDPEYNLTRRVSLASDVYSFGVVMLEVLTGRPHVSRSSSKSAEVPVTLVSSVLPVIQKKGKLQADVLDRRPALVPTPRQLVALELVAGKAARCLCSQGKDRPSMSDVVANLKRALAIIRSDDQH